jgi:hypothetical protein
MLRNSIPLLFSFVLFFSVKPFAQSIGQTKRAVLVLDGPDTGMQIETWNFTNPTNGSTEAISLNNFAQTPGFYEGISLEELSNYSGQKLVIDFVYMHHLCNEGTYDYPCTSWVVSDIHLNGTPKSTRKLSFPKIGQIVDPDGYVNVREQMNVKSSVVGKLTPDMIEEEYFYFFTCADPNWMRVDMTYNGEELKGYIHKSRIKIIH